jgi:hypothetical protein
MISDFIENGSVERGAWIEITYGVAEFLETEITTDRTMAVCNFVNKCTQRGEKKNALLNCQPLLPNVGSMKKLDLGLF